MARARVHAGGIHLVEPLLVMFGIKFRDDVDGRVIIRTLNVSESDPYFVDLLEQNVREAVESAISKLADDNLLPEQAKTLHESEANCVFDLFLRPSRYTKLPDELLNKSLAEFVAYYKSFRHDDVEMVVLADYADDVEMVVPADLDDDVEMVVLADYL